MLEIFKLEEDIAISATCYCGCGCDCADDILAVAIGKAIHSAEGSRTEGSGA